jgi:hypothetical protein
LNTLLVKNQLNQIHPKEKERDPYKCTTRNNKKDRKFETKNSPVHEQKKWKMSFFDKYSLGLEELWFWVWKRMKGRHESDPWEKSRIPLKRVKLDWKFVGKFRAKRERWKFETETVLFRRLMKNACLPLLVWIWELVLVHAFWVKTLN